MKIKRTAEQWQVIFEEQQQSGMTIEAFCRQKDIPITTFYNSRKKLERRQLSFIKATVTQTQQVEALSVSDITLMHGQTKLSLPITCEPQWLAEFVNGLQS